MSHDAPPSTCEDPDNVTPMNNCGPALSSDKGAEQVPGSSSERDRVTKEVGFTSAAFIGPAFPSQPEQPNPQLEDTLSEFYKELEKIESVEAIDGAPENTEAEPLRAPSGQERAPDPKLDTYPDQDGSRQRPIFRQHWYQNEPYNPRRPRPGTTHFSNGAAFVENLEHHHPPPFNRPPPPPRFHQPPHPQQRLPPPSFPPPPPRPPPTPHPPIHHPRDPVPHSWNQPVPAPAYTEQTRFDQNWRDHPPNDRPYPTPGPRGDPAQDPQTAKWSDSFEPRPNHTDFGLLGDAAGHSWPQHSKDRDWRPRSEIAAAAHVCPPPLVLILMRGLPGSGKSTLARQLVSSGPNGVILSTDDFFDHANGYCYDARLLGEAHEWNQRRAKQAMSDGCSPVIIDNTNIQAWEMRPYVQMALERGYSVDFREPDTSWRFDLLELERRNKHGVPQETIAQMLDHFSFPISVDIVMRSREPRHVTLRHQREQRQNFF